MTRGAPYTPSPLLVGDEPYVVSDIGIASCLDAASPVLAPGREFRRLATNTLDGAALASIAVSDRSFIIRTDTHLHRVGGG